MFKLLLVLKSPGGQSTSTAFSPAYLFILKGFAVRDNGTSVIRTVLCVIQRAFFGGSGPGEVDDDFTYAISRHNWGFTLGATSDNALPADLEPKSRVLAHRRAKSTPAFSPASDLVGN
jgi:hypothetical protein